MSILHFAESFSPLSETFIYDYVTELQRQGEENHVVAYNRCNKEDRPFPDVSIVNRPSRWDLRRLAYRALASLGFRHPRTADWPQTRERLRAVAREVRPDLIHSHFGRAGVMMAPVAKQLEVPHVTTFYGYDISSLKEKEFWRNAYKSLWLDVDSITVLSREMKQAVINLGCPPRKVNVIHLGRNLDGFPFRKPRQPMKSVLFVGRLVSKKAPLDAVKAVEKANQQGAGLELNLIGDGPHREQLKRYVEEHDMGNEVTIHGRVSSDRIGDYMGDADIFLLPSKTALSGDKEGTPTVLVEAQAVGLPCVATHHAGIPEMIPEENQHLLVPEGNVEKLAECLVGLTNESTEVLHRISKSGRKKILNEFNLEKEAKKLRSVYARQ